MKQILFPSSTFSARVSPQNRSVLRFLSRVALLGVGIVLLTPSAAQAVSGTWQASKTGNWSDAANWVSGIVADGAGSIASGAALSPNGVVRTITAEAPHTIGGFFLNANGTLRTYVLDGSTVTLAGATPPTVISLNGPFVINAPLDGTEGVRFVGQNSGGIPTITLGAVSVYTGNTEIASEGPLRIGITDALPHGSGKGDVVLITTGGHGYGNLDLYTNNLTINGLSGASGTVSTSGDAGTSTLTLGDNDATATFSGTINDGLSRQLALTKIGAGTQVLAGSNSHTFTGPTTVNAGTLAINTVSASPVTVNGGFLTGTGSIYSSVVVGAGGSASAGVGAGTMILYGLDLSAGGTNVWDLVANSDSNPGTDFDQFNLQSFPLDLTDSTLAVNLGGSVDVNNAFWGSSHTWNIITSPGVTGSSNFKAIVVRGGTPAGTFSTANDGNNVTLTFTPGELPPTPTFPKITSIVRNATSATVNYTNTVAGSNYVLQYRTNVALGSWTSVATNAAGGTTSSSVDNTAGASSTERFYRVYYFFAP